MLGQLPLNFEGLPSLIEGHHGMSPLGWNATFVENCIDAIFTPLGVMVDRVPLEGLGQEVCSGPVGGMLLLLWGVSMSVTSSLMSSVTYKKYLVTS